MPPFLIIAPQVLHLYFFVIASKVENAPMQINVSRDKIFLKNDSHSKRFHRERRDTKVEEKKA